MGLESTRVLYFVVCGSVWWSGSEWFSWAIQLYNLATATVAVTYVPPIYHYKMGLHTGKPLINSHRDVFVDYHRHFPWWPNSGFHTWLQVSIPETLQIHLCRLHQLGLGKIGKLSSIPLSMLSLRSSSLPMPFSRESRHWHRLSMARTSKWPYVLMWLQFLNVWNTYFMKVNEKFAILHSQGVGREYETLKYICT